MEKEGETSELSQNAIEAEKILIQQTQWISERYESINEGLMTRSASLAGFAGLELSLIGQMVITFNRNSKSATWSCSYTSFVFGSLILTTLSLLISVFCLLTSMKAKRSAKVPDHLSVSEILHYIEKNQLVGDESNKLKIEKPMEQLLMRHKPEDAYPAYLKMENSERGNKFIYGLNSLISAQVFLVIFVAFVYWR